MKFKVGDKVRIIEAQDGAYGASGEVGTVTKAKSSNGLLPWEKGLHVRLTTGSVWNIGTKYTCELLERKKQEQIIIYRKGTEVFALDKSTGKKASAKCSPEDTFDFVTGAKLAFSRLVREEENPKKVVKFERGKSYIFTKNAYLNNGDQGYSWAKNHFGEKVKIVSPEEGTINGLFIHPEWCEEVTEEPVPEPTYYNGKVVCVKSNSGQTEEGRIYEVRNGRILFGNDSSTGTFHSFEDLKRTLVSEYMEIVED